MVFQWPANPAVDQDVVGPGGQTYRWDGVRWVAVAEGRWAPRTNPPDGANNYAPNEIDAGDY